MEKVLENTLINAEKVDFKVAYLQEEKFTTKWWTSGNGIIIINSEYLKLAGYFVKWYI